MEMTPLQILKIELLCYGINLGEMKKDFRRYRFKRASLSEGVYFTLKKEGEEHSANLAVFEDFVKTSPFLFKNGTIYKNDEPVCNAQPVPDPEWYRDSLPDGRDFQSVLQQHGKDVLAIAISDCSFKRNGRGCLFCALKNDGDRKRIEDVEYIIKILKEKGYNYRELNINSGTMDGKDFGAEIYGRFAKVGKKEGMRVYIQIPPISKSSMILLKESGVDSISMNLEIFNDQLRKKFCPGKGDIKKEEYLSSLERAVDVFGHSQVSSWLIIGLEPEEETMKGIDAILETGAIPHPSIFRPLKGSELETLPPPSPQEALRIYYYLKEKIEEKKVNVILSRSGCINCGCCSVIL